MAAIGHIAPKLRRLLLMLSSDQPGEVVAAANAIGRALRANECDWHDLANSISAPVSSEQPEPADWHTLHAFCLRRRQLLRGRELDFVTDLADWHGDLSEKQEAWLLSIATRLRRAAA
jgi:hypothetical protein